MAALLSAIGTLILFIVLIFVAVIFALLIIGGYRAIKNELKGGQNNGRNNKP